MEQMELLEQQSTYSDNTSARINHNEGKIIVPVGKESNGSVFCLDIGSIPHILIAGYSGTGKTAFIQSLVAHMVNNYTEQEIRFIVYDAKGIDYTCLHAIPHLTMPVITDAKNAQGAMSWLEEEMDRRLKICAKSGCKDIHSYNNCRNDNNDYLPHIFLILDDFSRLQSCDSSMLNLLKNGRSTAIHLIIVTSIVSSKIISKEILAGIPCRIAFSLSSKADSRMVLGQNGAEELYAPGELIFRWQSRCVRCQCTYTQFEDMQRILAPLRRKQAKDINAISEMASHIWEDIPQSGKHSEDPASDELLYAAVDVVFETGQASVSVLQRRLKLGYARAARLIDNMEEMGIIGPFMGSTPRTILISKQQWETSKNNSKPPKSESERAISAKTESHVSSAANEDEKPDISMRDFAKFSLGETALCVKDNQICISKRVMTAFGSGTTTARFNGKIVAAVVFHKPGLFSHGYLQIKMKPNINIINNNEDIFSVTKENLSEVLKIEFRKENAPMMRLFAMQISQDIGIILEG